MTPEERVKMALGDLMVQVAMLQAENEELKRQLARAQPERSDTNKGAHTR